MSFSPRQVLSGESAARATRKFKTASPPNEMEIHLRRAVSSALRRSGIAVLAAAFFVAPAVWAQSIAKASPIVALPVALPDAPMAIGAPAAGEAADPFAESVTTELPAQAPAPQTTPPQTTPPSNPAPAQQTAPPQTTPPSEPAPTAAGRTEPAQANEQTESSDQQLKQEEHQRILGVMPAFNSVYGGEAAPLTPKQKFQLMFKSTTDPYVFGFAAFTAGIGQAQDSHAAYGQGALGYVKRFAANYADTADGNFWGNAVLPIVLHQDPRYFRLGHGTFKHRLLYSMSTTVICRGDNGKLEPNYSNVLGNLISGGISNVYYPPADRGVGETFQNAATVTAEGMIGAALIEFWPDIAHHYQVKRQEKQAAAAAAVRNARAANPSGLPPQ